MRQWSLSAHVAVVACSLALAPGPARAQDEGVKRVEQLVKKANVTVSTIGETRVQLTKTMDVYNALIADTATDRKDVYKKLQKEMESTDKKRTEIATRAGEMDVEAQALFRSWSVSAGVIGSADLRQRSEERLAQTKARYAEIGTVGQKASELYAPLMKTLRDHVRYLGHDLNAESVASLRSDAATLNKQAEEVVRQIDDTIATANKNIATLRP